jgi:hypothetical protein
MISKNILNKINNQLLLKKSISQRLKFEGNNFFRGFHALRRVQSSRMVKE